MTAPTGSRKAEALFAATTFLSAALMFSIQPLVGKALLPAYGGGAAVWASVMLFFQAVLLGGYALVHWTTTRLGPRRAALVQIALAGIGCLTLPLVPTPVALDSPALGVVATLLVGYGVAILAMAGNAPALQRWYAGHTGREPYRLYAVSNAGSLLGLAAYPLALELWLPLSAQGAVWRAGYALCLAGVAACAVVALRSPSVSASAPAARGGAAPTARRRLAWLALAALPSSLLLGATQHITVDAAPIPFLWALPLAVYLLTFIAAFAAPAGSVRRGGLFQAVCLPLLIVLAFYPTVGLNNLAVDVLVHLLAFGAAALLCHGRLAELRPDAGRLTEFYLYVSLGGVCGGLFNALLAPLVFDRLVEYPLALAAACLVHPARERTTGAAKWAMALVPAALLGLVLWLLRDRSLGAVAAIVQDHRAVGVLAVVALGALALRARAAMVAAALMGLALPLYLQAAGDNRLVHASRSFYGPLSVREEAGNRVLRHGTTVHGFQRLEPARETEVTGYYHPDSGIGTLLADLKAHRAAADGPAEAVVVGLGAGALACYGDARMRLSFIEIDPMVEAVARAHFAFLRRCGEPRVEVGDGRLVLAAKPARSLDLVVMDAFSSDAIPAHLVTADAIGQYLGKLRDGGVIAIHISNRYLDLAPVVATAARETGAVALRRDAVGGGVGSVWTVITRDAAVAERLAAAGWRRLTPAADSPVWRDDRWDLMRILRLAA